MLSGFSRSPFDLSSCPEHTIGRAAIARFDRPLTCSSAQPTPLLGFCLSPGTEATLFTKSPIIVESHRRTRLLQFQLVDEPPEVQRREVRLAVLEARPRIAPSAARARARPRAALVARCGDRCLHSARFVRADVAEEHALFWRQRAPAAGQDTSSITERRVELYTTNTTILISSSLWSRAHRLCDRVLRALLGGA